MKRKPRIEQEAWGARKTLRNGAAGTERGQRRYFLSNHYVTFPSAENFHKEKRDFSAQTKIPCLVLE